MSSRCTSPSPEVTLLTPSQGGLLSLPIERANHIDLLGQSLSVAAMRAVTLALSLLVAALWLDTMVRSARADETSRIDRRYRNYLLPVRTTELTSGLTIDVGSITALARIADHTGAPMLRGDGGVYHVVDGTRVYRYAVSALATEPSDPDSDGLPPVPSGAADPIEAPDGGLHLPGTGS